MKEKTLLLDEFEGTEQQLTEESSYGEPEAVILYDWDGGIVDERK